MFKIKVADLNDICIVHHVLVFRVMNYSEKFCEVHIEFHIKEGL